MKYYQTIVKSERKQMETGMIHNRVGIANDD